MTSRSVFMAWLPRAWRRPPTGASSSSRWTLRPSSPTARRSPPTTWCTRSAACSQSMGLRPSFLPMWLASQPKVSRQWTRRLYRSTCPRPPALAHSLRYWPTTSPAWWIPRSCRRMWATTMARPGCLIIQPGAGPTLWITGPRVWKCCWRPTRILLGTSRPLLPCWSGMCLNPPTSSRRCSKATPILPWISPPNSWQPSAQMRPAWRARTCVCSTWEWTPPWSRWTRWKCVRRCAWRLITRVLSTICFRAMPRRCRLLSPPPCLASIATRPSSRM